MIQPKTNENTILCSCGHPLAHHATGAGQCYKHIHKTEKRKDHTGNTIKIKCFYNCTCGKFEERSQLTGNLEEGK